MSRESILKEVAHERDYQDGVWGHKTDDTKITPWMWVSYVTRYSSQWMRGLFPPIPRKAIAVAAVESIDRQREEKGETFYERD